MSWLRPKKCDILVMIFSLEMRHANVIKKNIGIDMNIFSS